MEFIEYECDGKLENIFDRLKYDSQEEVLYLVSQETDVNDLNDMNEVAGE